jgi:hypothetical protein
MPVGMKQGILSLFLSLLISVLAYSQSKQLTRAVDQIKNDLKNNAWEIMDEGLTDINKSTSFSTGEMTFYSGRQYIFAAVIDNCVDCKIKMTLSDNTGQVMNVAPVIDRFKSISRVIYYIERDEPLTGTLEIYVDSPVKYTTYVLLAKGKIE